jgi:hypothetical protein
MSKVFLLVSALLLGGAAFGLSSQRTLAAGAENAAAARKACEQEAMRRHYTGKQRSRFIRQCLAKKDRKPDEEIVLPDRDPFSPPVVPRLTPSRRVGPAGTLPSNAPVVPSTPVIGSSGTSTSGSSATSTSGSSGTSIGGSRR